MSVYRDKKKHRLRFTFNRIIGGIRYRATKLLPAGWSQAQADAYDRAESARLYAQASGLEEPALSLAGAVQLYLDHRVPELRRGRSAAQKLALLIGDIEGAQLADVGKVAAEYTKKHRAKLKPATIKGRLAYLRAAVRYAYKHHGYGDRDYSDRVALPTVHNERQVYKRLPDLNRLWFAFDDPEARALYRIAFYVGARWQAEIHPRQPEDLIRNGRQLWLKIGMTKNGTPRMKPVHPAIREDLEYLPFTRHPRTYYAAFERARERVGMEDFVAHDQRHSLASVILSRGGTLPDVQAALHHDSVQSAKRYAHLYPERLRSVILGVPGGQKNAHRRKLKKAA
jgi:integrase